ncbi:MAG: DUF554 family protein, partial [Clostridia bacterium]|nr:DUF554 family protein [Clostridia bacterium]
MFGLGTLINAGAVILGGIVGILFKKGLPVRFREILLTANSLAVLFI